MDRYAPATALCAAELRRYRLRISNGDEVRAKPFNQSIQIDRRRVQAVWVIAKCFQLVLGISERSEQAKVSHAGEMQG